MTRTYLEWIEDKLAYHEREVAKLTIAREVLQKANNDVSRTRRKEENQKAPVHKVVRQPTGSTGKLIVSALRELAKPAYGADIIDKVMAMRSGIPRKKLHSALYNTTLRGQTVRDPVTKLYTLVTETEEIAA